MTKITIRLTSPSKCNVTFFEGSLRKASGCEKDRNSERKRMHLNALTTSYSMNPIEFPF